MRRKITKEEFKKVLDTLFPWGYTGNVEKWDQGECFLGWSYINEDSKLCDVMSVNEDNGGLVFWWIHSDNPTADTVTGVIDGMMHALISEMRTGDFFEKDGNHTVFYQFPDTDEPAMTDKEKTAADIVNAILEKDNQDDNKITDLLLDDQGQVVQVTFTGSVADSTIRAIGHEFGDEDPNVYSEGYNILRVIVFNDKHPELKD